MERRHGRRQGFTMVELLVVVAIIALLAAMLLPVIAAATASARRANCQVKQKQIFNGLRMYLNGFEDYLPLAWVVHKPATADPTTEQRFGYLSYWRFLIHEFCESGFNHLLNLDTAVETPLIKKNRDKNFWTDPARGFTSDYFAPILVFTSWSKDVSGIKTLDTSITNQSFTTHTQYGQLTQDFASTQRPMLTECDAGYPAVSQPTDTPDDWKGKPADTYGHKGELQTGWTISPNLPSTTETVLVGVGECLRKQNDFSKESIRFDFRHNRSVNVLFLDGHVDVVTETNQEKLRIIFDAWNHLAPTLTGP